MQLGDGPPGVRAGGRQQLIKTGRGAAAQPFMVMDVIAAANAQAASLPPGAPHVIRMEVGQPGTGAPAGAVAAVAAALGGIRLGIRRRWGVGLSGADLAALSGVVWGGGGGGKGRGDDGGERGLSAGLPRCVRPGGPGGVGRAVLSAVRPTS